MNFANVESITIPDGVVTKIMNGSKVLWEKIKTVNLIKTALAAPDSTEIYYEIGYRDGYRWSSSGKKESADTTGRITGWIPFVSGATYRIKNFYMSKTTGYVSGGYLVFYANDGTITTKTIGRTNANYDATTDTFVWSEVSSSRKYFRVSAYKCDAAPIITMDEVTT